jgi:YbbR domain-containing protein
MLKALRSFSKTLPLLLTSFLLAIAVWIMAVTSSDPSIERDYPSNVPVELIGQNPNLVITSEIPQSISLTLRAPTSIWDSLISSRVPVRAVMDLSGLGEGSHTIPIQVQIGIKPVEIIRFSPQSTSLDLEVLETKEFDIRLINQGSLAVGYQSSKAELSESKVLISGAKSFVNKVVEVRAVVRLTDAKNDINQIISLQPVDVNGSIVKDISLSPEKITVTQKVFERGGYRNVVVNVVTNGQPANGYRMSGLSVTPPTVTVFSSDPMLIDALPGYIETRPIDLSRKTESFEENIELNLPAGIQVIDDLFALVNVDIAPIIGNQSISDVPVESSGLNPLYDVTILPEKVSIIISGPLNILDSLNPSDLRVVLDLSEFEPGTYTIEPDYSLNIPEIQLESISPNTFKITIE